ncbi:hypothetical protein [Streptomyces sp. NPDC001889]
MQAALDSAVRTLLADPRLVGACDLVRLAVVVLLAKAPVSSASVVVRCQDLAGWLGCSVSHLSHTVIPLLRATGAVRCSKVTDPETGYTTALRFELLPLKEARAAGVGNPLAMLNRRDLATLLKLCEAVTCPGWAPEGKPETPAGFMAGRRGRGAGTDRLAVVRLVLQCRADGRVRMAPGRVAEGVGRADATVARLMDCPAVEAAVVVDRLLAEGTAVFDSPERFGRDRLRIPAVHAAYQRLKAARLPKAGPSPVVEAVGQEAAAGSCARCGSEQPEVGPEGMVLEGEGWAQESFEDLLADQDGASGDQTAPSSEFPQVNSAFEEEAAEGVGAEPHADHAPVAELTGCSDGFDVGFSGSAVAGDDRLPGRGHAREDQPRNQHGSAAGFGSGVGPGGPLRGEQRGDVPAGGEMQGGEASLVSLAFWQAQGDAPRVWTSLPKQFEEVLAPVEMIWGRLGRTGARQRVLGAVRSQLALLRGTFGESGAERLLRERLRRRVRAQGQVLVKDPVGWLISKALPRRSDCWDRRCDEGRRMDTGGECEPCRMLHADRRGLRYRVAADLARELPAAGVAKVPREVFEARLREEFDRDAQWQAVRHEEAAELRAAQKAAWAERRTEWEAAAALEQARPCEVCGQEDSGGLCGLCHEERLTEKVIAGAVETAVAAWAEPGAISGRPEIALRVDAEIHAEVEQARAQGAAEGAMPGTLVVLGRLTAELAAGEYRRSALSRLARGPEAEAESTAVFEAQMRRWHLHDSVEEAREAAAEQASAARWRTAEHLLNQRVAALRSQMPQPDPAPDREPDPYAVGASMVRSQIRRPGTSA